MAEVEEPQFTSLSQRIAALNQQQVAKSMLQQNTVQTVAKRPPPPPIPNNDRPPLPTRPKTVNNPPILTYGSSVNKQPNNEPIGMKVNILPPPPVDRDGPPPPYQQHSKTPPLPARKSPRNAPPPLPTRKASTPALPPRRASTQTTIARRGSNDSSISQVSTVSAISLNSYGRPASSITSVGSDTQRRVPPVLDMAKLPPLPPTRREIEAKKELARITESEQMALVPAKSASNYLRQAPTVDRDTPPQMPPRPRMPPRPSTNNAEENNPPPQPARILPPPSAARSILSMGFNNSKATETPNPPPRQASAYSRPRGPAVQELNANNFDRIILSGKFALVDFYAPYCKYCVELDPHYKQLAEDFAFASDRLVIAKVDVNEHKSFMARYGIEGYPTIMFFDGNEDNPEKYPYMRETAAMTEFLESKTGISPSDAPKPGGVPPPINLSSKPSMAQVKAVSTTSTTPSNSDCLRCRDFSGPDAMGSQYPREHLPRSNDNTGYLADVLCSHFSSATDKARAIFSWLHHNINYDVDAFFGNRVKHVTPADTIKTGLAVCGGYAGLFVAIAVKAGLEAIMVTGHGKGFGYTPLGPGERCPPPNPGGHAWNAVRIDGGVWKLMDPCWGSGHLGGNQSYTRRWTPSQFTKSNEDFGLMHFPADRAHFFRSDGRIPTWEEYFMGTIGGEPIQIFGTPEDEHGISQASITPPQKHIKASSSSDEVMRFQFSKVCTHYDFERNGKGKPYCMLLIVGGEGGKKEEKIPFEFDGYWWWVDVRVRELGVKGGKVSVFCVTTVNGADGRGLTKKEWEAKKGKIAFGMGGVAGWELV